MNLAVVIRLIDKLIETFFRLYILITYLRNQTFLEHAKENLFCFVNVTKARFDSPIMMLEKFTNLISSFLRKIPKLVTRLMIFLSISILITVFSISLITVLVDPASCLLLTAPAPAQESTKPFPTKSTDLYGESAKSEEGGLYVCCVYVKWRFCFMLL